MKISTSFLKDKNLLVAGLGKTGVSVINKTLGLSRSITGIDSNPGLDLKNLGLREDLPPEGDLKILLDSKITEGKKILDNIDLVIASPGIPADRTIFKHAEKLEIPIWSELELAWRLMDAEQQKNTIAVTGTNGKTTVVNLIGEILGDAGMENIVCGNVGLPLIDSIILDGSGEDPPGTIYRVIEVSSFQLEKMYSFKPHIGILLNITSDHMDRHRSFDVYGDLKLKLFSNQEEDGWAIVNFDDEYISGKISKIRRASKNLPVLASFSAGGDKKADIWYMDDHIYYNIGGKKGNIGTSGIQLIGMHNISNIMAAIAPAIIYGVGAQGLEDSVKRFKPLDHRLEYLGIIKEIRCFNDSKSTNPDATMVAVAGFKKEITLIMGGRDKDMDFNKLLASLDRKINNLILIGEAAPKIFALVKKADFTYKAYMSHSLKDAVSKGFSITDPGGVLMLSPACASMDMFRDYIERGNKFKELVQTFNTRDHGKTED